MKRTARASRPLVTLALTTAIVAVYGAELTGDGAGLCTAYGLVPAHPTVVSAVASLFLHDPDRIAHVAGNLAVLVLVGARIERMIGSTRFAAIYLAGGLAGAALHIVVDPTSTVPLIGASGSLFALLAIAATLRDPAMLTFIAVLVATNVWRAFGGPGDTGVSFACHLGGFFGGAIAVAFAHLRGVDVRRAVAA